MGAGVVKAQVDRPDSRSTSSHHCRHPRAGSDPHQRPDMVCEACNANFGIFKKKRQCLECGLDHCSNCLRKDSGNNHHRRCEGCLKILSGNFTRQELLSFKIRHLRAFLSHNRVPIINCTEKNDLIELVLKFSKNSQYLHQQVDYQRHTEALQERQREREIRSPGLPEEEVTLTPPPPRPSSPQTLPNTETTEDTSSADASIPPPPYPGRPEDVPAVPAEETPEQRAERLRQRQQEEMQEAEARHLIEQSREDQPTDTRPGPTRMTLDKLNDIASIEDLTVRQLKEVLATNFVDYKGCVEKHELVVRVKRLWSDHKDNSIKHRKLDESKSVEEKDVCKVCMDAMIDCVLLECGHIMTCTQCGKRLAECPVCRQYVSRVVRIFKA